MPAKSKAQQHLMQAVAHNQQFARKVGIPQTVAKEFGGTQRTNTQLPATAKKK
jgi:hypothetical protein